MSLLAQCTQDVPNSRAIAKQLLTLSQDPDNQPFIVQEQGCLAGLVQYSAHVDTDVVLMATRALQFLSSHPQNKSPCVCGIAPSLGAPPRSQTAARLTLFLETARPTPR